MTSVMTKAKAAAATRKAKRAVVRLENAGLHLWRRGTDGIGGITDPEVREARAVLADAERRVWMERDK